LRTQTDPCHECLHDKELERTCQYSLSDSGIFRSRFSLQSLARLPTASQHGQPPPSPPEPPIESNGWIAGAEKTDSAGFIDRNADVVQSRIRKLRLVLRIITAFPLPKTGHANSIEGGVSVSPKS
jgi:hypothetical protein